MTQPLSRHESCPSSCDPAGLPGTTPGPGQGTHRRYGGFLPISRRRVSDVGTEEDHRLLKDGRAGGREEKAAVSLSFRVMHSPTATSKSHRGHLPSSGLWPGHPNSSLQGETGCEPPFQAVTLCSHPQITLPQAGSTTRDVGNKPQHRERQRPYAPLVRHKDVVDPAKLDVDLEAEVGKGLRGGFYHILDLDALRGHSQEGVPDALHLGCGQRKQVNTQATSNAPLPAASSETGREIAAEEQRQPC